MLHVMSTATHDRSETRRPTREEGLAMAARRKAARRRRTGRIRKAVAVVAVAAFLGPFTVIYTQLANGKDPELAANNAVVATADASGSTSSAGTTASGSTAGGSTGSGSTTAGSTASGSTTSGSTSSGSSGDGSTSTSPAPLTTQQS